MLLSVHLRKFAVEALRLHPSELCYRMAFTSSMGQSDRSRRSDVFFLRATDLTRGHISRKHLITFTKRKMFVPNHTRDGVPKEYDLVFENALKNILGPCRIVTSAIGLLTVISSMASLVIYWPTLSDVDTVGLSVAALVTLPTVVLVNVLSRRYFLRIYFHEKRGAFIGVHQNFMGGLNKIKYSPADVNVSTVKKETSYDKSNVKIFGNPFHLRAQDFILPKYFNMHTGHLKLD